MITIPALKVRQFGVEFYQTSFTSKRHPTVGAIRGVELFDRGREGETAEEPPRRRPSTGNCWRKRIAQSEAAFQRPVIRKKIRELVQYYRDCQEAQNLPAIPGAVIMITEKRLRLLACRKE